MGLQFAKGVMDKLLSSNAQGEIDFAKTLVSEAEQAVVDTSAGLLCTVWLRIRDEQIFFSCGTNTLHLVIDGKKVEIIEPHSVARILSAEHRGNVGEEANFISTHLLGRNCAPEDIHKARIPRDIVGIAILAADATFTVKLPRILGNLDEIPLILKNVKDIFDSGKDTTFCIFKSTN